jgi:hypothetical protein
MSDLKVSNTIINSNYFPKLEKKMISLFQRTLNLVPKSLQLFYSLGNNLDI